MKVFVTGATGVLGRAAIASLCSDGHQVAGIARDASKATLLEAAGVRPVQVSLFDTAAMTAATRWRLGQARAGRSLGLGDPRGWAHIVHPSDAGAAVAAALTAPGGVYNVGAEPVRRDQLTAGFAEAVGRDKIGFLPKLLVTMAGERLEPLTRSHRVSSDRLHVATGWKPRFQTFDVVWLSDVAARR
ncbi:MAG: NAD(P)H-binding protein [Nocardioidaceae bacterium]